MKLNYTAHVLLFFLLFIASVSAQGSWQLLLQNAGIACMHAALTHYGNVIFLDRTNIGPSPINLPNGVCRNNPADQVSTYDCTAHSVLFMPASNTVRPLFIQTDTWCSSGQIFADGTLVQTGGDMEGLNKVRYFTPCPDDQNCDWVESDTVILQDGRWYATNQLLPDGSQIVVGGRSVFTYEFIPPNGRPKVYLPLLEQTSTNEFDNLYPFVHLLPDGTLYIFANRDSIILDYTTNTVLKTFPQIPGEPRNYPAAGSSVMLPLQSADGYTKVEVLICGGAQAGAYLSGNFPPASDTCGRIVVTDPAPAWDMSTMPFRRSMGDMVLLPTGEVLIINGVLDGSQGWDRGANAITTPVIYQPTTGNFINQAASDIPRVYHSVAVLLPDSRVLIAGSNTHQYYTLTNTEFPTELRVEAFSPDYLNANNDGARPYFITAPGYAKYGDVFTVTITIANPPAGNVDFVLESAPFTTHSYSQGQRMLYLQVTAPVAQGNNNYNIDITAPPNANLAPATYYMLFAVNQGIPGPATWIQIGY